MSKHIKILALANPTILGDEKQIKTFFYVLLDKLGMRPLGEPSVFNVPIEIEKMKSELFEDEGGITINGHGIASNITLSTSHCALHTWPVREELHLDIYSCRHFDKHEIEVFVINFFECYKSKISDLSSFTEWD